VPRGNDMQYELLYIVPTTFTDDDVSTVEANVKALLEKHGASIVDTKRLGKFRFTYPIKKQRHGHYILVNMETEPQSVLKIDEGLRISTEVLRHLILRSDEVGNEKYEMVQFAEVNTDLKDDRPRRRRDEKSEDGKEKTDDVKVEGASEAKEGEAEKPAAALTDDVLDKKLSAALEGDVKEA
jgi:small subunit ribosomal protein S6